VIVPGSGITHITTSHTEPISIEYHRHNSRYNITWIYLLHNPKDCIRISEYKPLGLKENKQKAEMISSLLGKLLLHESSPQAARSVARAILHIIFLCHPVDSFTRILHLSGYPQGWDRFTSPSVCKLYCGCNR